MTRRFLASTLTITVAMLPSRAALYAQAPADEPVETTAPADDAKTRSLRIGRMPSDALALMRSQVATLERGSVTIAFDRTPARVAFERLRRALRLTIIGRYSDDVVGHGIDPNKPITLTAENKPALEVLEMMLEQCSEPGSTCTWQLRKGFLEVGTKGRLSVPAARETRLYYIADLIIDIPKDPAQRTFREYNALNMVQEIVETIEPDSWDWGQPLQEPDDIPTPATNTSASSKKTAPAGGDPPTTQPDGKRPRRLPVRHVTPQPVYVEHPKIAIIRYWRDYVIVHAPDYIHRRIAGYAFLDDGSQEGR